MAKEIIYIGAEKNSKNNHYFIYLYHKNIDEKIFIELNNALDILEAQKYAIFYAMFYIRRNNYSESIILSDSKVALEDKIIKFLAKELNVELSWIPKEINSVIDNVCKDCAKKNNELGILNLFIKLSEKSYIKELHTDLVEEMDRLKSTKADIKRLKKDLLSKIEKLQQDKEILKEKIKKRTQEINSFKRIEA